MAKNAEPKMPGEDSGQVMFGQHVVTLIDFLGQQSGLAKWDFLPKTEHDQQRFIAAVQETFGKITEWRGLFEKNFNIWLKARQPPESLTEAVPDGGRAYREFADTSLDFMHFSDTIVIYSPVVNRYGHANVGTIMSHVYTCGTLMLAALNQNTVFRGAIEIGMAGQLEPAGIYGPALAAAHQLESKEAKYPRILVGARLREYLFAQAANPEDSASARTNWHIGRLCASLLGQDVDGNWIVDYLNDGFAKLWTDSDSWGKLRDGALRFVTREYDRFEKKRDEKLAGRYKMMAEYYRSRGFSE